MGQDGAKDLICGSAAGMLGKLVEHPFDTVKVRLQTQTLMVANMKQLPFNGPIDAFRKTLQREGVRGLYQGLPSPLLGAMFENAILFFAYRKIQKLLQPEGSSEAELGLPRLMAAGAMSGACVSFVLSPVELVKCQVQVHKIKAGLYSNHSSTQQIKSVGSFQVLKAILKTEGPFGLLRGWSWTFLRESGGGAAWFGVYEAMIRTMLNPGRYPYFSQVPNNLIYDKTSLQPWQFMLAGGCAGIAYNFVLYPADVIKSVIQTQTPTFKSKSTINEISHVIKTIYLRQGLRGFYQGLGITLTRAIPSNAVVFLTFEKLQQHWESLMK